MLNFFKNITLFSLGFLPRIIPVFFYFLFTLCLNSFNSQYNLVPNGSFEEYNWCPAGAGIESAYGWFSPNGATPDLFNACCNVTMNYSVPENGLGYQIAQDGQGYASIFTYGYGGNYREYLATKLTSTLKKSALYKVTFYTSLTETSPIATNNLGIGFTSNSDFQQTQLVLSPLYVEKNNEIIYEKVNWQKVEFFYFAEGIENFLLIGNFNSDTLTNTYFVGGNGIDVMYYVDNVSIVEISLGDENCFTPNDDGINDVIFKLDSSINLEIEIVDRWGNLVSLVKSSEGWNGRDMNNKIVSDGVYFFRLKNLQNKYLKTGFIHLVR